MFSFVDKKYGNDWYEKIRRHKRRLTHRWSFGIRECCWKLK